MSGARARVPHVPSVRTCSGCSHFDDAAARIEAALPGLSSLSSAYAAVRSGDGLCAVHDRYVAPSSRCGSHSAATSAGQS
jgi:hypothetical protein